MNSDTPLSGPQLSGRVAVVTGASRGIGRAAALALAREGAHVVALARTVGGLEDLDDDIRNAGGQATLVPLDLKDHDAIDRLGAALFERWGKLDILFGNAEILGVLTPLGHLKPKIWDDVMAINLTANYRLIRSLDPLLRQSDAGRALFVSSAVAQLHRPYWGGYAVSKAGLEMLALTYAEECRTTQVKVNVLNPGPTRTKMRAQAMPGEDPETLPAPDEVSRLIVELLSPAETRSGEVLNFTRE